MDGSILRISYSWWGGVEVCIYLERSLEWDMKSPHLALVIVIIFPCVLCLVSQSCPTLWDPRDCAHQDPLSGGSPGKNTGVGCHVLLQGIFSTQGLNPGLLPQFFFFAIFSIFFSPRPGSCQNSYYYANECISLVSFNLGHPPNPLPMIVTFWKVQASCFVECPTFWMYFSSHI